MKRNMNYSPVNGKNGQEDNLNVSDNEISIKCIKPVIIIFFNVEENVVIRKE